MLTVEQAQAQILDNLTPLSPAEVGLAEARGLALAADVVAHEPLPPFDNSAMDGYAVLAGDTNGAGPDSPVRLRVVGDLPAGVAPSVAVEPGTAIRIMTGAPMPPGADAVVMVEDTEREGDHALVKDSVRPGQHVRLAGDDVAPGQTVLRAGRRLGPGPLGMLAALGMARVPAIRRPRVALLTTGDEVLEPGRPLAPGKIYNSNRYALAAQIEESGAFVAWREHAGDDPEAVRQALAAGAAAADILVTTGGVSVGDYDFLKDVLRELGELGFWRVAMKPGKPLAYGRILGTPLFGLPGNPVSAMLTFELFVRPAIRKLGGHAALFRPQVRARLTQSLRHIPGRREFARAITRWDGAGYAATPLSGQGSHQLQAMTVADSLIVVPEVSEGIRAGETADVVLLSGQDN